MNPQIEVPDSELQGFDDDFGSSGGSMKPVLVVLGLVAVIGAVLYNSVASLVGGVRVEIPDLQPRWNLERDPTGDDR